MFRIIQTIWLDQKRAQRVRTGEGRVDADSPLVEPELAIDGVREMDSQITYDAVRRAMGKLPEEQRSVMMLVCVEGQSYKEAADTLSIPIGTVMSRLSRARTALAKLVGEPLVEGSGNVVRLKPEGV